jgi:serine/threonine-protein kinase
LETATPVDLVVSAGPPARPLPSFTGLTSDEAEEQADESGVVLAWSEEHSDSFAAGLVVDQDPPTGTPVVVDDEVVVTRSLGPPLVEVPDVLGLSAATAADLLLGLGFVVVDTVGPPNQVVVATDPAAGEILPKGSNVTIRTTPG